MTGTSSANPAMLAQFASDGMVLGHELAGKASALRAAVDELTAAGESVPGLTGFASAFEDLAYDWLHLDGFAGKVAQGFADHLVSGTGGIAGCDLVISVSDATIAARGEVGLADRDEAIRQAEAIARRLEALTGDDDASVDDIAAILGDAGRAMYDPAFAVTLSEALGVDGYVDVVGTIREVHDESGPGGIDAALADVAVLGTVLTTALGQADPDREERAPDDLVLDQSFVDELTHGYDPGNIHDGYEQLDLSVLVAETDPPTDVAVEIANHRISPFLDAARSADVSDQVELAWGDDRSGVITNYTEMLARNPDASAAWLDDDPPGIGGGSNLNLVLHQDGSHFIDDGRALADVVENGVTHDDFNTRREIMRGAIEIVGAEGDVLANDHMPEALAKGVAADMPLLDQQVNLGWTDTGLQEPPDAAVETHEFLREVMRNAEATNDIYSALGTYTNEEILTAPPQGEDRNDTLRRVGALQGMVVAAEANAVQDEAFHEMAVQNSRASGVNFLVGLAPGSEFLPVGALNDLAEIAGGSTGQILFSDDLEDASNASEEYETRRADEMLANDVVALAIAKGGDAAPELPTSDMTDDQLREFLTWLDETYNDDESLRTDRAHMRDASTGARDEFRPG